MCECVEIINETLLTNNVFLEHVWSMESIQTQKLKLLYPYKYIYIYIL